MKKDYYATKRTQKKKNEKKLDVASTSKSTMTPTPTMDIFMISSDLPIDVLLMHDASLAQNWILDSSASFHVTPNREWFSTYSNGSFITI